MGLLILEKYFAVIILEVSHHLIILLPKWCLYLFILFISMLSLRRDYTLNKEEYLRF